MPRHRHVVISEAQRRAAQEFVARPDRSSRLLLPTTLADLVVSIAEAAALGDTIVVGPASEVLTAQEAADILGLTRPEFVQLARDHTFGPSQHAGQTRYLRADVLAHLSRLEAKPNTTPEVAN